MTTDDNNIFSNDSNSEVHVTPLSDRSLSIKDIFYQLHSNANHQTHTSLQECSPGLWLLRYQDHLGRDGLAVKKLSDRIQYAVLPKLCDDEGEEFVKLSFKRIKNLCYISKPTWLDELENSNNHLTNEHNFIFYFQNSLVEEPLKQFFAEKSWHINERLSNRAIMVNNGQHCLPINTTKIAANAIWHNHSLKTATENELNRICNSFTAFPSLIASLKKSFGEHIWHEANGTLSYEHDGVTRSFDYVSLLEDLSFCGYLHKPQEFFSHFQVQDLNTSAYFPTISVRSLVHLKARPHGLSQLRNGYALCCSKEKQVKQSPVCAKTGNSQQAFSMWLKRSSHHLYRHIYNARVVFPSDQKSTCFSLVGEQVASISIFPELLKGVFESIKVKAPESVRLIAHNEDVLTIAYDTSSWSDINLSNQKASALFKLVAKDGSDPLSLFEQVIVPPHGAGTFNLRVVPDQFFELIDTATRMKKSMPPGHDRYLLGLAYECIHEWGLAVGEFEKALRLDNSDPDILSALGSAYLEIGDTKKSLPFLKRASALSPENAETANNLGRSSMECGEIEGAIKAFERAVNICPGSEDYLVNLGIGYLVSARMLEAQNVLEKAIRCNPRHARAHHVLAQLFLASGDKKSAKHHAMIAYKENPVDSSIANLLWKITVGQEKT